MEIHEVGQKIASLRACFKEIVRRYVLIAAHRDHIIERVVRDFRANPNGELAMNGIGLDIAKMIGTALHWAVELEDIGMIDRIDATVIDVNKKNWIGCTALHMAVLKNNISIVRMIISKFKDKVILTEEDNTGRTPLEIAHMMGYTDIVRALMECNAVVGYVDALYRDRQVYVDAANAILVGAALIASVTFASWLQPPLGYSFEGHADIEHNKGLKAFWWFNNLSFFFAIATVVFGARSVLPRRNIFIKEIVRKLRTNLLVTSILLGCSVLFVITAFALAGCIILSPIPQFPWNLVAPIIIGGLVCLVSLMFLFKSIVEESRSDVTLKRHTGSEEAYYKYTGVEKEDSDSD